jgi:hypothetical protein
MAMQAMTPRHGVWQRSARIFLVAAMMVMMMLTLSSATVSAGGGSPTLFADQNPVIVPFGQTAGGVKLTWDVGKGTGVEFYYSRNGGPEKGPFYEPVSGQNYDTLTVGDSVTYQLYSLGKGQLLDTLTVTAMHPVLVDCALYPCISDVGVSQWYSDGEFTLNIDWLTSEAAGAVVALSTQPAISNEDGNEFAHVDGAAIQIDRTGPKHTVQINGLQFATYYYVIKAIDADGHSMKHYGVYHMSGGI